MECTQKLECTQDLYETHVQRICPEEIGFLGICGIKYPVKKGPNKIGRDPQACSIALNLNSVSRQHAVINVLSNNNFMIMDLDSANKTRLGVKTLQPYIPHPLKDGDTVQFGDVFGIFRLLEQDDELPMTQAIDIPDTPMTNHHMSRINKVPITTVPESPDVSDRDDSYVAPSQKDDKSVSNHRFVNPSSKIISIQPIGSKKINNVYWNSSKKSLSLSLSLNNSNASLDNSDPTVINRPSSGANDIHDMKTQDPTLDKIESFGSIHAVETQMPEDILGPSIYSQDTQVVPTTNANMPGIQKVYTQHEMQINLFTSNKENKDDLYEAETQLYHMEAPSVSGTPRITPTKSTGASNTSNDKVNSSHEEIIFDEINTQSFDEPLESQSLIPEDAIIPSFEENPTLETNTNYVEGKKGEKVRSKKVSRVKSSDSTDCEDIETALTQIISEKANIPDEDVTDCEDIENNSSNKITDKNDDNPDDIEYLQTQIIEIDEPNKDEQRVEDMATQILVVDTKPENSIVTENPKEEINFEDLPTQILVEDNITVNSSLIKNPKRDLICEDLPTQLINQALPYEEYSQEIIGSFKIPLKAPIKNKRKDLPKVPDEAITIKNDQYYQSTQDVFNDLCSEEQYSPEIIKKNYMLKRKSDDNKRPLSSIIDCVIGSNIPHNEVTQTNTRNKSNNCDYDVKLVSNSFKQKKLDVIVQTFKRTPSDSSDVDSTPKKGTSLKFMDSDLPNSQEIKKSVNMNPITDIDVFSSDSETENNSQDDDAIPLLYHKKKKPKVDAKLNLTKRFEADALPSRIITRVRKPTEKAESNKKSAAILKPNFLTEQEDGIDNEIITENISRLKTNNEKSKSHNKETTKILYKPSIKKYKEPDKRDARAEISKTGKSNKELTDKSISDISEDKMGEKLEKSNSSVEPESTSRRTRSKNINSNYPKEDKKYVSPENVKCVAEKKTLSSKLSNTSLESKQADRSKVSLDTTRGSNLSNGRPKRSRKEKVENRSVSPELELKEVKPKRTYRKRTKKTPDKKIEQPKVQEKETELRRSRRIKTTKEVKEPDLTPVKPKSILKPSVYDQSTVYNKSSESMTDSPNSLKRSAINEFKVPSPKRTRSAIDPNGSLRPPKIHYVLFTTFPEEGVQAKLEKLGAVTVTDVSACTVLLTLGLRRTFKLLCAVGLGRPVVGRGWVQACVHTNTIVDPWSYLLKDEAAEKRFHFDLERTLLGKRNYLKGFTVSSTPSVLPAEPEMKQIVECSGGVWGEGGPRWTVVSTPRDSDMWPTLRRRGAKIVSSEFVLEGVLRQKPDIQPYLYK